jgi:hypothetical protein
VEFNTLHFYKDYTHIINNCPDWKDLYNHKIYMVRNHKCIHHGAIEMEADGHVDIHGKPIGGDQRLLSNIRAFHYGHVRTKESYVKKYNKIEGRHDGWKWKPIQPEDFEWLPDWKLCKFDRTHPKVMDERIAVGTDKYDDIMELYK